jgi:hypothetical protein
MKSLIALATMLLLPLTALADSGTTINIDGSTFAGSTTIDLTASATADSSSNAGVPLITAAPLAVVGAMGIAHILGQGL